MKLSFEPPGDSSPSNKINTHSSAPRHSGTGSSPSTLTLGGSGVRTHMTARAFLKQELPVSASGRAETLKPRVGDPTPGEEPGPGTRDGKVVQRMLFREQILQDTSSGHERRHEAPRSPRHLLLLDAQHTQSLALSHTHTHTHTDRHTHRHTHTHTDTVLTCSPGCVGSTLRGCNPAGSHRQIWHPGQHSAEFPKSNSANPKQKVTLQWENLTDLIQGTL